MSLNPFAYGAAPHVRKHAPAGYPKYGEFKDWLRDEFCFRCVYCLERETWYPSGMSAFSADHVITQSADKKHKVFVCDYTNLIYACLRCNSARRNLDALDPTKTAFASHFKVHADGLIVGLTKEGKDVVDLLHLDSDRVTRVRRHYIRILSLKDANPSDAQINEIYLTAFSYPADMPDLRRSRPPGGNALKANTKACYFAQREMGALAQVY